MIKNPTDILKMSLDIDKIRVDTVKKWGLGDPSSKFHLDLWKVRPDIKTTMIFTKPPLSLTTPLIYIKDREFDFYFNFSKNHLATTLLHIS